LEASEPGESKESIEEEDSSVVRDVPVSENIAPSDKIESDEVPEEESSIGDRH
jgi:hypothetical protein